jgi:peptide/nickel transport system substrate-binding protein
MKPGTLEVEPWLAESWTVSDDGLVWTFKLRNDVLFQDGTPFNADAVEFSFMRMVDKNHPYHKYGTWKMSSGMWDYLKDVKAISEYTVQFTLDRPWAAFLTALASSCRGGVVSPTAVKADPEGFGKVGTSTGPFKIVEWRTDDRIVLERFDGYWGDAPYLDQIIIRVIPENTARLLALQQGEIHVMYGIDADIMAAVKANSALVLYEQPGVLHGYLTGNLLRAPWDDVRVRTALFHAINRQAIVDAFYPGGTMAEGVMPTTMLGFDDSIEWPEYNPEKARQLLAEAGYPNGFSTTLRCANAGRTHTPEPLKVAEAIQADLAAVGIKVEIIPMDSAALMTNVKAAEHDLELAGFSPIVPDSWTVLYTQFDSRRSQLGLANNFSFYRNPEYDALNDAADKAFDPAKRAEIYRQMQQIIRRDVVRVDLADVNAVFALRSEVRDFAATPLAYIVPNKIWLAKAN